MYPLTRAHRAVGAILHDLSPWERLENDAAFNLSHRERSGANANELPGEGLSARSKSNFSIITLLLRLVLVADERQRPRLAAHQSELINERVVAPMGHPDILGAGLDDRVEQLRPVGVI